MSSGPLWQLPATALAAMVRGKEVSPVDVVESVLERIRAVDTAINACVVVHAERAVAAAREAERAVASGGPLGRLHGVPITIKDNVWAEGDPAASGSRLLAEFRAPEDSPVVARLRRAGAIIVARTNMPEFAWRGTTEGGRYPPAANPWATGLTAGGSSGGAAAAVAAGMAPLAIGTDGAGSIRLPASFCGVVGFKPTFGRIAHYPAARGNELNSHIGPLARTVADCAALFEASAGFDARDPLSVLGAPPDAPLPEIGSLRVAWSPALGDIPVEPEVASVARSVADRLADLGASVTAESPGLSGAGDILDTLYGAAQAGAHADRPPDEQARMDQDLVRYARDHRHLLASDYVAAMIAKQDMVDRLRRFFDRYDLLVTPTVGTTPFPLGLVNPDRVAGRPVRHLDWSFCYPFNYSGQPAVSLPAGWSATGLPIGAQLVGRRHEDALVLHAAEAVETAQENEWRWPRCADR